MVKAKEKFEWSAEEDTAFMELKTYLTNPPVLTAPNDGEEMLLYIAATDRVVSTVLVVERTEAGHVYPVQRPVYYVSEVLNDSKHRYHHIENCYTQF